MHAANTALLAITAMSLSAVTKTAPALSIRLLEAEDITELHTGLCAARKAIAETLANIEAELQRQNAQALQTAKSMSLP